VALPLRVLSAAWRMGFLGAEPAEPTGPGAPGPEQIVVVSATRGWARLAAPYGSAYHRLTPELGVLPG
jgi:hypothetical protein